MIRKLLKTTKAKAKKALTEKKDMTFKKFIYDDILILGLVFLLIIGIMFCICFSEVHISGSVKGNGQLIGSYGHVDSLDMEFEADVPLLALWWIKDFNIGGLGG